MDENKYPLVSFVSLTYNHAKFVEDTLTGALSQDYPNLEIIISDDASTDGTYEVMQRYLQEHPTDKNIRLNRNEKNLGFIPHFNYVLNTLVHGEIIVLAGGDDISMPNRVAETVEVLQDDKSVMAVTGQIIQINAAGERMGQVPPMVAGKYYLNDEYIRSLSFMCGAPGLAIRKDVWDTYGPLLPDCPTEDSVLRFRALSLGQIYVSPNIFIKYRIHENNISRPGNIYNLKTSGIVAQLRQDLAKAQELHLVSEDMVKRLEKKISLYAKSRNMSAMKVGKPWFVRGAIKMIQRVVEKQVSYI